MSGYALGIPVFGSNERDLGALADAADTHKAVETGHNRGKRVFTLD